VQELGDEWRKAHEVRLAALAESASTNQVKKAVESKE